MTYLKKSYSILSLSLLFFVVVSSPAFSLTPEEKKELIQIRELLIQSRQELQVSKLKISDLETSLNSLSEITEKQRELLQKQEIILRKQDRELKALRSESIRQYSELKSYYQNRETGLKIKTAAIGGGVGLGVGFIIALLLLL